MSAESDWGDANMAANVNLDALIPRADLFESKSAASADTPAIRITDLEPGITYDMLRKPDFQRETADWQPQQVVRLIQTFCESDIIPAVILWQSGNQIFVVDGAHRLSALVAWIRDDYGAGVISQRYFNNQIPEAQRLAHAQTAALVEASVGRWDTFKQNTPVISLKDVRIQWIKDYTAEQAAEAFIRINQGGTTIKPLEERILRAKRSALAVATRVVARGGTGHPYWGHFTNEDAKSRVPKLGAEIYKLLFEPRLMTPIKSLDIPLAGVGYGPESLRLAFDLVALANGLNVPDSSRSKGSEDELPADDEGDLTAKYLNEVRKLVRLLLATHPSSFGLHPALYCYSSKGVFQPAAILNISAWMMNLRKRNQLDRFRKVRGRLEELMLAHPELVRPESHKLGSGSRTRSKMVEVLNEALGQSEKTDDIEVAWAALKEKYPDRLVDDHPSENGTLPGARFHRQTKSAVLLAELPHAQKCPICKGFLHINGKVVDHKQRRADGGTANVADGRWVHPVCNSNRIKDEGSSAG
jgi:hypothetical protein